MRHDFTVYTNNLISIDGSYVGRIDRDSYHSASEPHKPTKFYPGTIGTFIRTGFDIPHEITAALYVGGPADWEINPDFVSEVKAILWQRQTMKTIILVTASLSKKGAVK